MRHTVRVLAGTAALALAAAGCGGKQESAGSTAQGGAGWSAGVPTVKVGLIAPLTGPFAVLGISQKNSMQVEIDRLNAAGGLGGSKLEIVERDSGLDPGKAVQAANELAGDAQVKLIVGPSISAFYNAAKGVYESQQKVNCQPAVATGDFSSLKYGFRSQDKADEGIRKMLASLKAEGATSVGVIYEGDDTGKGIAAAVEQVAGATGIRFLGYEATRPDDQSHAPYINKLKSADAIWISNNVSGAKTMAAAAEAGYKGKLVSGSGMQNVNFLEAAGAAAQGARFAAPNYQYPIRDRGTWKPGYRQHIEAVVAKYGENVGPNTGAKSPKGTAIAADCIYAFGQAANAAKSLDSTPVAQAWEKLDLADTATPSGNSVKPGTSHEMYDEGDIRVYEWNRDGQGWFTKDLSTG